MRYAALLLIRLYQRGISPLFPASCRFHPTCSQYARLAIEQHGLMRGVWLAVRRIGRCHPFHPGGLDPVPPVHNARNDRSQQNSPHGS